jgi:hypothetical protein
MNSHNANDGDGGIRKAFSEAHQDLGSGGSGGRGLVFNRASALLTGEARDMEPQGPGVRAAGGPTELQGI